MYLPKSKYKGGLYTSGNEYRIETTGMMYTGPYFEIFNGDRYVGTSPEFTTGQKLISYVEESNFRSPLPNEEYDFVRNNTEEFNLRLTEKVSMYYPVPSNVDYTNGRFIRYFLRDKTTGQVLEVAKSVFTSIKNKEVKYYYPKYEYVSVSWSLTSKVANERVIPVAEKILAGLSYYLKDPSQFVK